MRLPGVAHGLGRRHRLADGAEAINQSAFLVNAYQDGVVNRIAYLRRQERDLFGRLYVTTEENDAARLDFAQKLSHAPVKLRARNAYEEHTPGLKLDWQLFLTLD
jgi:hypothetical protein